jgi:hypothetical protein
LAQRIEAVEHPDPIEVRIVLTWPDGTPASPAWLGEDEVTMLETPEQHWRGIPVRFRDRDKYRVQRTTVLGLGNAGQANTVKLYESATGTLVWSG